MNQIPIREQILEEVDKLNLQQQEQLLRVARQLRQPATLVDTPGEVLLADLERYQFEPGELDEMLRAIEEETERIDWDGWQ